MLSKGENIYKTLSGEDIYKTEAIDGKSNIQ
jgi:hypothetical protein